VQPDEGRPVGRAVLHGVAEEVEQDAVEVGGHHRHGQGGGDIYLHCDVVLPNEDAEYFQGIVDFGAQSADSLGLVDIAVDCYNVVEVHNGIGQLLGAGGQHL
nr:hypothetical protein [Tanacetum cinerariifolium]